MSERDWTGELERYLRDRFAELCRTIGQSVPLAALRINPALALEESKYFLLGLEAGLFHLNEEGCVQSELLPPPREGDTRQKACLLFCHDPFPPRFLREGVCQLSTASFLILQRGWLKSHILLEPSLEEDRFPANGADILVKSITGELLVCVEVKRSVAELQKLVTDLRACCNRGAHPPDQCGFPQNHPKFEFCALYKPTYFWGVAPEADICLRMKYDGDLIEMDQLPSLPPRSLIELSHK